jgi:hypothetical protein
MSHKSRNGMDCSEPYKYFWEMLSKSTCPYPYRLASKINSVKIIIGLRNPEPIVPSACTKVVSLNQGMVEVTGARDSLCRCCAIRGFVALTKPRALLKLIQLNGFAAGFRIGWRAPCVGVEL